MIRNECHRKRKRQIKRTQNKNDLERKKSLNWNKKVGRKYVALILLLEYFTINRLMATSNYG